jgi:hypothetical protein
MSIICVCFLALSANLLWAKRRLDNLLHVIVIKPKDGEGLEFNSAEANKPKSVLNAQNHDSII